ncbi:hypothetical protein CI109_102290 [Kwoniella shandongensis]|uniref:Uncharacterized protein n=1 Tax=Kwoniella shandongensis TaxID=1734106 RepID=A0A5M6BYL0_9TREE|nr:uncharacterized protein CI109_003556 [Kwoniella shandongensis]KAA5527904.1 hypothetical protein CI109_003556 [Kwoniella shandongensis]
MFSNLTYEAFFSLLDEYFASRPQNRPSSSTASSPVSSTVVSSSTITRSLPPPNRSPAPPLSPPPSANGGGGYGGGGEQQDFAQRFISSSIRLGTAGTKASVGAVSKNKDAMDLLDKVGAAGMMRGANQRLNSGDGQGGNASISEINDNGQTGGRGPPPPVQKKKHGVSGLVSGKTFGHVDTSSKMSAFTSMWKDPQKAQAPAVEQRLPAALPHTQVNMPPPRRSNSQQAAAESEGQAQALYDYAGADSGDLSVQANQVVNIVERTSEDWWTCEDGNGTRGLVPATYLKAL